MTSLYGIETYEECLAKIDELLKLANEAEQNPSRETVGVLKETLRALYGMRHHDKMSSVEQLLFEPAIEGAYNHAPHLGQPKTWVRGIGEVQFDLDYWRDQVVRAMAQRPDRDPATHD